jgi:abortive infection bacteriophage resistance protein
MANLSDLQNWCSHDRLAAYVADSRGSDELAVKLYEWNAELCGAFMEVMHHVEVLVRNRLHDELARDHPNNPDPWYKQAIFVGPKGPESVADAERRIAQRGNTVTPARVISSLPFGFWNALFGTSYEKLWRTCLHRCFKPHGPGRRKDVVTLTERIRLFRNCVAHHERLYHQDVRTRHDDLLKLAMWIDPDARDWISSASRVNAVINARPRRA